MISATGIRADPSQVRVPVTVFETAQLRPDSQVPTAAAVRNVAPFEVNLSGTQLAVGFISALSGVSLLLWVFLRLWLFER
jgi:hypothetical protein